MVFKHDMFHKKLTTLLFFSTVFSPAFMQSVISKQDPLCDCTRDVINFNRTITFKNKVKSECRQCYEFTYDFQPNQTWATSLCVSSTNSKAQFPMFIVVRESVNVMSFQLPLIFPEVDPYSEVCRTLCPLANYKDSKSPPGPQSISVEISTSSKDWLNFAFTLSNITDFVIKNMTSMTVTITPSKPRILQYNIDPSLRAVRIEATSLDDKCMIMAIQDIQCPIYDSVDLIEPQGYFQTLTRQSGISITRNTFHEGKQYIVLLLKPTDDSCIRKSEETPIETENRQKEVTIRLVPSITDGDYYLAIFGALGFFVLLYLFSFFICCLLFVQRKRNHPENQNLNVENPNIQNYGTSDSESQSDSRNNSTSRRDSPISFDETDMDKLPDAEFDKNVVRTKTVLYVSDLSRKKEKYLSSKSKVYSWNLLTIAIFYGLPVIQLVYINQGIVNMTGNQDLCYYNFLCSHQVGSFSDFNHIYSNIGYVLLGILFLLLVWRRESWDFSYDQKTAGMCQTELKGIPRHFGLMYAMGWALVMEGVLSASYHVCPNRTNFQFDTAFMYVIATVCMLKLYQSRHPDIMVQAHTTWMVLALVIIIGFGGVIKEGISLWVLFVLGHLCVTAAVSTKIYYMGRWKLDRNLLKRIRQTVKVDIAARSMRPTYMGRFFMLCFAVMVNVSLDIYGIVRQPPNFGAYLLSIFISNLLMYLTYYSLMKIRHKEGIRWIPIMYMVLSFVCWIVAMGFFLSKNTSWQVTPAESREVNKHCIILNFFDHHDIWHFLSSCALFFSFMVLFTLDDNLENIPRSMIVVF